MQSKLAPELQDFRNFVYACLDHLGVGEPTRVQYDIADFLQHGPEYGEYTPTVRRYVVQAQRGEGKSWLTSFYTLWRLAQNPGRKVLVASASAGRAASFTSFTLQLIKEAPFLQWLQPGRSQRQSTLAFDVAGATAGHDPSMRSVGIMGQMAGAHVDLVVGDDIEIPNNSDTVQAREKLAERVKELDAIVNPGGEIVLLGTPQVEDTLYDKLPERGYWVRVWPGRYPPYGSATLESYSMDGDLGGRKELAPSIREDAEEKAGEPTDPERFNELDLQEREASYRPAGFQLQFMLNPNLSDLERRPFRLADITVMDLDTERAPRRVAWTSQKPVQDLPKVGLPGDILQQPAYVEDNWDPYDLKVMGVDPAGRGKDELAWAVVGLLGGVVYLLDIGGTLGGYDTPELERVANVARRCGVDRVAVESNFGDGMFTELFRPILHKAHQCSITDVRAKGRKEKRIIEILEPVLANHRFIADRGALSRDYKSATGHSAEAPIAYCFQHQLTRLTPDPNCLKHDDRVDALSIAVSALMDFMGVDSDEYAKMRAQREVDEVLDEEWMDLFGRSRRPEGHFQNRGHRILRGPKTIRTL